MRSIVTVSVLIFVFVCGSIFFDGFVASLSEDMAARADSLETMDDVQELTRIWEEKSRFLELIVDHKEIDSVNQILWAMEAEIEADHDEFLESKALAVKLFRHIGERNTLALNNVF